MFETFIFKQFLILSLYFKKRTAANSCIWMVFKKIGSISIKRNKVTKENLGFFEDVTKIINNSDRP